MVEAPQKPPARMLEGKAALITGGRVPGSPSPT